MKIKGAGVLLASLLALSAISCASAPKTAPGPSASANTATIAQSRKAVEDSRTKALEVKAEVAAKTSFDLAETGYAAGKALEAKSENAAAQKSYDETAVLFQKAQEEATVKRDAALKLMGKAEEERKTSEQALTDAAAARTEADLALKGETVK